MSAGRVLVVDDDDDIRESIVEILEEHEYDVTSAADGEEALAVLHRAGQPDVILLDLMMPVMDGKQFRALQLADPALAQIPVIVLSAQSDAQSATAAMGGFAFLKKPATLREILATVDACLTRPR